MRNKKLDHLIDQMENYLECWKQFNHFLTIARAKKFTPEDDSQFLEIKSIIVQELELILASLEVSTPTKEEIHSLVGNAPSLRFLSEAVEGAFDAPSDHDRRPRDMPGAPTKRACGLRISRWSFLFDGPAALGRRPRPGRPTCCGALGRPSGSAWPSRSSRRPRGSSCAAARPSRTSCRFEVPRPVTPQLLDRRRGDHRDRRVTASWSLRYYCLVDLDTPNRSA